MNRALAVLLCVAACSRPGGEADPAGAPPSAAPSASVPLDTTAPGEIAEGNLKAFGLALPRDMVVTARMHDAVYASGNLPFEPLSNYLRERVLAERVDTGPTKTVFAGAVVKAAPSRRVDVELLSRQGKVQMVVRDRTQPPPEEGLTEEERWRRAGLTPDGRVLKDEAQ